MFIKWMAISVLILFLSLTFYGCDTVESFRDLKDDDPKVRLVAIEDLVCFAELPGYPASVKTELRNVAKSDTNTNVRMGAITGLCRIEEEEDIFPFLIELLGDPDPYIRVQVLDNLPWVMIETTISGPVTRSRRRYEDYIPIMVNALNDEHPRVREKALEEIANNSRTTIESVMKDQTQALISTLKVIFHNDDNYYVRVRAAIILSRLHPEYTESIPLLMEAMHKGRLRIEAMSALYKYGPAMSYITGDLIEIIRVASVGTRDSDILNKVENGEDLIELLQRENPESYLLEVIEEYEPDWAKMETRGHIGRKVLIIHRHNSPDEEIFSLTEYSDDTLCRRASLTLMEVTSESEDIKLLVDALDDENPDVRRNILWLLGKINPESYDLFPKAVEMLDDKDKCVRGEAINALGALGPSHADRVVPVLFDYLITTDDKDYCNAIDISLHRLDVTPVPFFVESMKFISDIEKMKCVLDAININDFHKSDYSPTFIDFFHDESAKTRFYGVLTLGYFDYEPNLDIKLLEEVAAEDPSEYVRQAALDAIEYLTTDNRYELQDAYIEKFLNPPEDE